MEHLYESYSLIEKMIIIIKDNN